MTVAFAPVCVLGAGPAGCVAAYRLATLGHEVTLLARARHRRHMSGETVPDSVPKLLHGIGLGHVVESAAYRLVTDGLSLWETETPTLHPSPALLLRRDLFDALLRRSAEDAGVRVVEVARASPRRLSGGGWQVTLTSAGAQVETEFLVDARGQRRGPPLGAPTIALMTDWRDAPPLPATTCIEAVCEAWAWGGAAPGRRQAAACFLDPERLKGLDAAARLALYLDVLAGMRLLRPLLGGQICAPPLVLDATARVAVNLAEPDRIAVGDAAVATEPLSSQGLQGAIVSALQGAAVAHTVLTHPDDAGLALDFHRSRRLATARHAQRHAASFHSFALARFKTPFWRRRAGTGVAAQFVPVNAAARAALDAPLLLSPLARFQDGAVLDGALIRRRRVLDHPTLDAPVAYLGPVDLARLLETTRFPATSDQLIQGWSQRLGPESATAVLSWLCAQGVLMAA